MPSVSHSSGLHGVATVRRVQPRDHDALVTLWLRSVRETHWFMSDTDVNGCHQAVRDKILNGPDVWVAALEVNGCEVPVGWIALEGRNVDALFVDPTHFRRGIGRMLLRHARAVCAGNRLSLQVYEANDTARKFYEAEGLLPFGRSPVDGSGRLLAVIHMREPQDEAR